MTDQDALLAAIIANPADDGPRLIYADWLRENGEEERGLAICAQIASSRRGTPTEQAISSVTEILRNNPHVFNRADPISRPIPIHTGHPNDEESKVYISQYNGLSLGWFRGFVNCVTCTAEAWFREAANIVPVNPPIELVTLTTTIPILLGHPKRTQWSDRDRGNVVIRIERPIWFGPLPHRRPADDVVCIERHTSEKEITLARDRRFLEAIETEAQNELDAATSLSGYLNMKWGDKGDHKGHVKKFTLPQLTRHHYRDRGAIDDLVQATLRDLGRLRFADITSDMQRAIAMRSIMEPGIVPPRRVLPPGTST